jgi:hypothetical protein
LNLLNLGFEWLRRQQREASRHLYQLVRQACHEFSQVFPTFIQGQMTQTFLLNGQAVEQVQPRPLCFLLYFVGLELAFNCLKWQKLTVSVDVNDFAIDDKACREGLLSKQLLELPEFAVL